ncbi:MAG: hypothetical protein DRQ13_09315, partial [Ignavibacteriae bacterium]
FFLLLLFFSTSFNSNAQLLAPLNLNNSWIYENQLGELKKQTIVDTTFIIDSVKYCKVRIQRHGNMTGYYEYIRLNDDSFYVWRNEPNPGFVYEEPYYKKNAQLGEMWIHPIDSLASVTVIDIFPSAVFGVSVNIKILKYIGAGGLTEIDRWWTEEFGRQVDISFWGDILSVLKGCIIDGVAYGDTSFYLTSVVNEENKVNKFALMQNYPNPFNSSTIINYSLPSETFVRLTLYNNLGEEVKELIREEQTAGIYEYKFISEDLPSGVYFYSITTNNFMNTKKMLLLR